MAPRIAVARPPSITSAPAIDLSGARRWCCSGDDGLGGPAAKCASSPNSGVSVGAGRAAASATTKQRKGTRRMKWRGI